MRNVHTELPATDFAITSVNVPDRLDMREVHDRSRHDEEARRARVLPGLLRAALRPAIVFVLLACVGALGWHWYDAWRVGLSASSLSKRLSAAAGVPVTIAASALSVNPSPRLVLSGIVIDGDIRLEEASASFGWAELGALARGGEGRWGEFAVAPVSLKLDQARRLIALAPRVGEGLPAAVSGVRFDRVQISDHPWATGPFSATMARGSSGGFDSVLVRQSSADGLMKLQLSPVAGTDQIKLQCEAQNWVLPFGPRVLWTELLMVGLVSPGEVEIGQFSLGSAFGVLQGHALARLDKEWSIVGTVRTGSLDLESMLLALGPKPPSDAPPAEHAALQGTASFDARLTGRGPSLALAANQAAFDAPVQVRWGALNGVNLGYAATRPGSAGGTSGGSTRFTALDVNVHADRNGIALHDIHGRAGAMFARGQVDVLPDGRLSGMLHVDLGATRVQAPIRVVVRGEALHPEFGR